MKKIFATTVVLATLGMAQQVLATDGTVHFTGSIVNAPCVVGGGGAGQINVDLGENKTSLLDVAKKESPYKQNFQIVLEDCVFTGSSGSVTTTFTGLTDLADSTLLRLDPANTGAKNVAVRIDDAKGAQIKMGVESAAQTLTTGKNTLNFTAYYVATGVATAGSANATTDFNLTYN